MNITPLKDSIKKYLKKHRLEKKFLKTKELFEQNINHPSLNVELLEPKNLKVYSLRIDIKYRANLIKADKEQVNLNEIFDNTLEELELDKSVNNSDYEISFEIADNIKDRTFLLDEDLITRAFYSLLRP